jgi:hypothetical protein
LRGHEDIVGAIQQSSRDKLAVVDAGLSDIAKLGEREGYTLCNLFSVFAVTVLLCVPGDPSFSC